MHNHYTKICYSTKIKLESWMNRRYFLNLCATSSTSMLLASKPDTTIEPLDKEVSSIIRTVQEHMFPLDSALPSANVFRATEFLLATVTHTSYDKDLRKFLVNGAKKLQEREKGKLLDYSSDALEKALRSYEESSYGGRWLDHIVILSLEALLSDPIYGGNYLESGWNALGTKGGDPRPSRRYIEI